MVRPPDSRNFRNDVGFQRPVGARQRRQLHADLGLAVVVGNRQLLKRLANRADLLVRQPK
jgi:hypothetical protein